MMRTVDLTRCFNCRGCEKVCRERHGYQRNIRDGERLKVYIIPTACRQCEDPVCVSSCKKGAHVREGKISYIIRDKCIGCGICVKRCPFNAVKIIEINAEGVLRKVADKCDRCRGYREMACFHNCPSTALKMKNI